MTNHGRPYTRDEDLDNYLSQSVYPALYERLNTAFPEFDFDRRSNHWVARRWPPGFPYSVEHERPDRLMVYADRPYWIKIHGHSGVRFLELVNGGRKPVGREFVEAARRLCELAGVQFPGRQLPPEQEEAAQAREIRRSILDSTAVFLEKALWSKEGAAAREYLTKKRGFAEEEIRSLSFGFYSSMSDLETWLKDDGQDLQIARDAGVLWPTLLGYITIPWRDDFGRPLTLYGRWHTKTPPVGKPKTIALPGEGTKGSPLYFDRVRDVGHRDLVLVEGVFDAALLQVRGDTRVVASGAAQLSGLQLETLRHHPIKRVFICGDPDGGGDRGTHANITALQKAGIQAFVVPPLPDGCDPDEYVMQNGIEGWRSLVDQSLHSYEFLARTIISKHKTSEEWASVQLAAAIDEAIEFDRATVNPERGTDLDLFFWSAIRKATGVSEEALAERLDLVHNKKRAAQDGAAADSANTTHRPKSRPDAQDAGCLLTRCVADIDAKPVCWLWPRRIARGKLSILAGNPGLGKSQVTASIAAIITTGGHWPVDGQTCQPGDVLFLSAEDDPADTLRPRLEAAGADLRRVHVVDGVVVGYKGDGSREYRSFCLQVDIHALEAKLAQLGGAVAVIIDPISAYLGDTDSHKNAEVRGLLTPLNELAARYSVAVIGVSHLSKAAGSQAIMRVNGSLAFVAAARAAYLVATDPNDKGRRLFLPLKNNLGPDVTGLAFEIEGATVDSTAGRLETSRVVWAPEPVLVTADEAMQAAEGSPRSTGALAEAKGWLRETLENGPVAATQVTADAKANGISEKTLQRAATAIRVQKMKSAMESGWFWSLSPKVAKSGEDGQG